MNKASIDEEIQALRNVCGLESCGFLFASYRKRLHGADGDAFSRLLFKNL